MIRLKLQNWGKLGEKLLLTETKNNLYLPSETKIDL